MSSIQTASFYRGFSVFTLSFLSVFTIIPMVSAAVDGKKPVLVPHRATYDLTLGKASGRSGIVAIQGRMAYEFTGADCEGYTVNLRIVTQFTDNDNKTSVTDVRTSSWEAGDGSVFRFSSSHFLNNQKTQVTQGIAKAGAGGKSGSYTLDKPAKKKTKMPLKTLFPTAHLVEMIEQAKRGESIFEAPLFDGGDGGKVYQTTTFIGPEKAPGTNKLTGKMDDKTRKTVENIKSWPISISYFEGKSNGEETPAFEFSFDVFENGIASKVLIDYGVFSMKGKLNTLELLEGPGC
jgi:EipB-like